MAKFLPGPAVGQISGRVGGSVFSHNKGGPYIRNGTIPTVVTSPAAIAAKTRMATISALWETQSTNNKTAWALWAQENPVTDRLGASMNLSGHQAYNGLNCRLAAGDFTLITTPPIGGPPVSLTALAHTVDLLAASSKIEFTATPLAAEDSLWIQACVLNSHGILYVKNRLRLIKVTDVGQASDYDHLADLEGRFGALAIDQRVVILVSVFDSLTGLLSSPLKATTDVVDTTP